MNDLNKFLYHKYVSKPKRWYPFLAVYYLTYACNFRCSYCSDGSGTPYYELPNNPVEAEKVIEIFKRIRKYCNTLVITGGEPLNYPDFKKVISKIKSLKFKEVVLTTNGHSLDKYIYDIKDNINNLVISIDTLDIQKANNNIGLGQGVFEHILDNLKLATKLSKGNYKIEISSVVTPENINDLYEVYEFSQLNGYTFAAAPQLEGVKANKNLENNNDYYLFYDFLIKEKKRGRKVFGSTLYLEYMRDLKKFNCNPFTMLVVSPDGEIFYPCLEIGNYIDNILNDNNLHKIKTIGKQKFGQKPNCGNQCHSACALGFSLLLKHPYTALQYL